MPQLKKIAKFIWDEFIYGGHLLSLGGVAIAITSGIALNIKITIDCLFAIYLIVYTVYLYNRFKEINIDSLTNIKRTEHLKLYIAQIPKIFYFTISIIIGIVIYFSNIQALFFCLFLLFLGWLYTIFFKKITKKIIGFKNLCVASTFALLVFFPIVYYSAFTVQSHILIILLMIIFIFSKALIMQIFFDLKDIESDKKEKLLTLPIILGKEKTINILKISSVLTTLVIPVVYVYTKMLPAIFLMLIFVIPFNFYCYNLANKNKYSSYILGSAEFILWPILITIGKIII